MSRRLYEYCSFGNSNDSTLKDVHKSSLFGILKGAYADYFLKYTDSNKHSKTIVSLEKKKCVHQTVVGRYLCIYIIILRDGKNEKISAERRKIAKK